MFGYLIVFLGLMAPGIKVDTVESVPAVLPGWVTESSTVVADSVDGLDVGAERVWESCISRVQPAQDIAWVRVRVRNPADKQVRYHYVVWGRCQ